MVDNLHPRSGHERTSDMDPSRLRSALLAVVRGGPGRRPAHRVPAYAAPYASRVAALDVLLTALPASGWTAVVVHGWTPAGVAGHLMAVDGLLAAALGAPVIGPSAAGDDPEARTDQVLDALRDRPGAEAAARWREQAAALCHHLDTAGSIPGEEERITAAAVTMRLRDHLAMRAYETWMHSEDICSGAAEGLRLPLPVPDHVHTLSQFGCRMLRTSMMIAAGGAPDERAARITLTGPGGGTRVVRFGRERVEPAAEIEMDVIDFCFLLGDRLGPDEVQATVTGDPGLARDVLTAAPLVTRLRR
ncbi:hypothetical protein C1I98_35615 [Spongiactinospora gelatinilytica]|uniref:Mycothiol-dependent maleylpyruvate isomerase metal-binding domain-containing protein n=2 Tax=Spongiactinospora gelatinilytica TaxID=2666298 RepID=A0A2W2EP25_9ACTN|nr:hypothetical protein C1I98_35615 [Spongiactinospora gelatinilytica]